MSALLQLLLTFVQVGLLSIGGGYAAVPIIQSLVVDQHAWLDMAEFTNLLTISEMTPGPIVVNAATFIGLRIAGLPGAVVATLGSVLPSMALVTLLGLLYARFRGLKGLQRVLSSMRPAVVALIASAFLSILLNALSVPSLLDLSAMDGLSLLLFLCAFIAMRFAHFNSILTMLLCGVLYAAVHLIAGT